jgi:four helix bundle protein
MISDNKEFVLSKQILKSGTSIGANTEEAIGGISKKDFVAQLFIAYKEARETKYWLKLLKDTGYIKEILYQSLLNDCEEILKILYSIIKTSKANPT